ncbi:sensor histidine kinase [Paucibacter aquatile]|uniref:Sensor histidine kinase n=2 Tax=Kinneretia aquatilis TaxID=2070761 RepID=A0A2N8KRQ9_9BURK|nr:sensor histidine kinase [Paucibacter aquatile]
MNWPQILLRQALIIAGITLFMGLLLTVQTPDPFGRNWDRTQRQWLYCFLITVGCSLMIQLLARASTALINLRRTRRGQDTLPWPGWPLSLVCLVLGTLLGYSLAVELGNSLTGEKVLGPLRSDLRSTLGMLGMSLLPGLALTIYFVGRGQVEAARNQALNAERLAAENQLRLLESQLEPHMLFNTLANLRVLIGMDAARAQSMLDHLIAFLRATLNASRSGSHPLREEFARLRDYLALMQVRMGSRLQPQLDLPAELAELPVPPLLLQPLVENAIKHGLEPAIAGGLLQISARREGDQLILEVLDHGVGLSAAKPGAEAEGTHFGLHQVRARLATQFGDGAGLRLQSLEVPEHGTRARIHLPLSNAQTARPDPHPAP